MAGAVTSGRKPLLEREDELQRLRDLVLAAGEGRGASVLLEGPRRLRARRCSAPI
jgi:hypothetical protein